MTARKLILVILLISVSFVTALEKRSDDVSIESLMTLVQQQAAKIDQLTATNQAMQAQLTSLQTTVQQQSSIITNLTNTLNVVSQRGKQLQLPGCLWSLHSSE